MDPLIIQDHYEIDYRHSYAEDSPFFVGLTQGKLQGSRCTACGYTYATPRSHCMECGAPTSWHELPLTGRVHTYTTCHYGGELFLKETPFTLILVEFDGADTLFLSRLKGVDTPAPPSPLEGEGQGGGAVYIGMPVVARFAKTPTFKVTDVWFEPAVKI
jgi:uncharacterized protein